MPIRLGDTAPNFTADTTEGKVDFYKWKGDSWAVLFSHPKDFTPVCTTELGRVASLKREFEKRSVKVMGLSVDPLESHKGWMKDIQDVTGHAVNFPMIADADRKVSDLYDMIHPNANDTMTVRSVFVIDPNNKVRLTITYPASTGRNFDEILRVIDSMQLTQEYPASTGRNFEEILRAIDSLQLTANYSVATPSDWKQGEDVIIASSVTDEDAKKKFPDGWNARKPYLRVVPQPGKERSAIAR